MVKTPALSRFRASGWCNRLHKQTAHHAVGVVHCCMFVVSPLQLRLRGSSPIRGAYESCTSHYPRHAKARALSLNLRSDTCFPIAFHSSGFPAFVRFRLDI